MDARLEPGDPAPDFTLPDHSGREITLSDLRGRKVIVYFYPAAMTPGCATQACDFTRSNDDLEAGGFTVLGISPDSQDTIERFRSQDGLTITLLSDPSREVLKAWGAFGEKKLYGKVVEGVIRSTFVVDEEGRIAVAQYNVRAKGHVDKLRRDLGLAPVGS